MSWWRRKPKETDDDRPPTDAETADIMRSLADEFVRNSRSSDLFDYTVGSVTALEVLIGTLLESASDADLDRGFSLGMGAYIGEVIVRNSAAARWTYDAGQRTAAVESAHYSALPAFKVSKRFTLGPEHSLVQFVDAAIADELPPDARRLP
ncbi:hypothetical protein [Promicromonospora sukumoe]|uniref:hypothetical protein n=1 Tax=Promicromonospora sukumoe TaxID=88382 RepID=UPI000371B2B6|nr:hypothetical protein [Promicromonospora sukumoe]